jgi:hypothetical protein
MWIAPVGAASSGHIGADNAIPASQLVAETTIGNNEVVDGDALRSLLSAELDWDPIVNAYPDGETPSPYVNFTCSSDKTLSYKDFVDVCIVLIERTTSAPDATKLEDCDEDIGEVSKKHPTKKALQKPFNRSHSSPHAEQISSNRPH